MYTTYKVQHSRPYVKPTPAELPRNYQALVQWRYSAEDCRLASEKLAQGELDVLEACRVELGWKTTSSLITKWYPNYPSRKAWARALSHCRQFVGSGKLRTRTLNLKYLLLAVITHFQEQLHLIYDRIRIPSILPISSYHKEYSNTASLADRVFSGVETAPLLAVGGGGS
jgi:hypothetical protein